MHGYWSAAGKVTVGRRVSDVIGAVYLSSPPDALYPYRTLFERLNGTLRGLYYSLCNYALANKARRIPVSYTHLDVYKRQTLE